MCSRKEQQAELLIRFGELLSPLEDLVRYPDQQTPQSRAKASAKFTHDRDVFEKFLYDFMAGERGHNYKVECTQINARLNRFTNQMVSFRDDTEALAEQLKEIREVTKRHILAVPCDLGSAVLEASSPFSAFVRIRSICETSNERITLADPYMGQGSVRRYLHRIPNHVRLTVITKRRTGGEFADFLDVSKLLSDERGPSTYRLMFHTGFHDRYIQSDNTVFHLGGSLKDAGRKSDYTVTQIQQATDGESAIAGLIQESDEVFGPSTPKHPLP